MKNYNNKNKFNAAKVMIFLLVTVITFLNLNSCSSNSSGSVSGTNKSVSTTTIPKIASSLPSSGSTNVKISENYGLFPNFDDDSCYTTIKINWAQEMSADMESSANYAISGGTSKHPVIYNNVYYSESDLTYTTLYLFNLEHDTTYTFTIPAGTIRDANGNYVAKTSITFTTGSAAI